MILVQLHQRKEQLPRDSHTRLPSQNHGKQSKTYFQNPNMKPDRVCQDIKTSEIGKTEMGESLGPLGGEELVRIPSSGIQVLFMLSLYLWAGHARNCQYTIAFIQQIFIY